MIEFTYNNAKNASSGHTSFKLNYSYYFQISYKEDVDFHSKSKSTGDLLAELRELIIVYQKNLYHPQEILKQAHNKGVKPRSYISNDKILLNSKYIKTKQN